MTQHLGYLTIINQPKIGFIGGFLILNAAGRPLEFHCTMPVQPDKIQKILYGESLHPFLCSEVIVPRLFKCAKSPVSYFLTNIPEVLPAQKSCEKPLLYVFEKHRGTLETISAVSEGEQEKSEKRQNDYLFPNEPVHEISEELSESLKSFGIENRSLPTLPLNDTVPSVPEVVGFDTGRWQETRIGNRWIAVPDAAQDTDWNISDTNTAPTGNNLDELTNIAKIIDLAEPFTRLRLAIEEAQRAA